MKRRACWGLAAALVASAGDAAAQTAPDAIRLLTPVCVARPVPWEPFVAALRVELGAEGYRVELEESGTAQVVLSVEALPCADDAPAVEIVVNGPPAGRFERIVSLADVAPGLRARTVALASAQLVQSSHDPDAARTSSDVPSPSVVPPEPPPPPPPTPATAPQPPVVPRVPEPRLPPARDGGTASAESARRLSSSWLRFVGAGGEYRRFTGPGTSVYGGRAISEWRTPWKSVALRADVAGTTGSAGTSLGSVSLWSVVAALGGEWYTEDDSFLFGVGPVLEVGYTRAVGRSNGAALAGSGGASTLAALVLGSARRRIVGEIWAALEVEAGAELWGVRALVDDRSVSSTAGGVVAGRFVLAYSP